MSWICLVTPTQVWLFSCTCFKKMWESPWWMCIAVWGFNIRAMHQNGPKKVGELGVRAAQLNALLATKYLFHLCLKLSLLRLLHSCSGCDSCFTLLWSIKILRMFWVENVQQWARLANSTQKGPQWSGIRTQDLAVRQKH